MTNQQRVAIENHCRFAFETAQRQFCRTDPGGKATVIVTVNSGYE